MAFIDATRQNRRQIGVIPFNSGQRASVDLPQTGLLANLLVRVNGTLTVTPGTGTATYNTNNLGKGFALVDRIHLTANSGTEIVNVTGTGMGVRMMLDNTGLADLSASSLQSAVTNNPVYQFGTSSGTNTVNFTFKIPVAVNDASPLGLILLQNRETLITLALDWANPTNLFTLTGNAAVSFTGNAYVSMEYFSVPVDQRDYPDLSVVHTLLEDQVAIAGTGDFLYTVPRGNIYQKLIHRVILNGSAAGFTDVYQNTIQYNQSEQPYKLLGFDMLQIQRDRYNRDMPQGVYVWDFAYQGQPGYGGSRDLVNSRAITDFLSILNIASSATLGSNNNYLYTLREQLVPLR
jgi:hypothetical protein